MKLVKFDYRRFMWNAYGARPVLNFDPRKGNDPLAFRHLNKERHKALNN